MTPRLRLGIRWCAGYRSGRRARPGFCAAQHISPPSHSQRTSRASRQSALRRAAGERQCEPAAHAQPAQRGSTRRRRERRDRFSRVVHTAAAALVAASLKRLGCTGRGGPKACWLAVGIRATGVARPAAGRDGRHRAARRGAAAADRCKRGARLRYIRAHQPAHSCKRPCSARPRGRAPFRGRSGHWPRRRRRRRRRWLRTIVRGAGGAGGAGGV